MILSPNMFEMLQEVLSTEPIKNAVPLDVPSNELGEQLIKLYYRAEKPQSRKLIAKIMQEAGGGWSSKLYRYDHSTDHSEAVKTTKLKTLDDFLRLIAENDDYERSTQF